MTLSLAWSFWGMVALTLWGPRKRWNSVWMRKITSICHNLDRQGDRRETQCVSQSIYTQTQGDTGALLTCPITQAVEKEQYVLTSVKTSYVTLTPPPPPPPSPLSCWNGNLHIDPDDHPSLSSLIMCVSLFPGSSRPTWKPWSFWLSRSEGTALMHEQCYLKLYWGTWHLYCAAHKVDAIISY